MNTAYRKIQDAPVLGKTANILAIVWANVQPFSMANVQYELRFAEPPTDGPTMAMPATTLFSSALVLTGDDYTAWGDDDEYLYTKVAEKLGVTLVPEI